MKSVPQYYAGQKIFLSGATGFIGKVVIEKVLRACPEVGAIYCLIRPKKGQSAQERLRKLLEDKLYDRLREEQPDFTEKVHAIHGDVQEDGLGLRQSDVELLHSVITIVFHSAATVRFDEPLRIALDMNVLAVRKMIKFSKGIKNLQAFVHVSTAYAYCDRQTIDEIIYPSPVEPQKVIDAVDWMTDDMIAEVTPKLLGDKPNTYTYTKALAETLLIQEGGDLPLVIVRPSIVTAAWQEPIPGWIDNWNGPSGMYVAAGKGILRSMKADSEVVADLVPVDLPVNLMIAAAWYMAEKQPQNVPIFHVTTGGVNPCYWGQVESIAIDWFKQNPLEYCYRRPKLAITKSSFIHDYWLLVSHLIPAYIADFGYMCIGRKPRMVHTYQKLHKTMGTLEYFTVRSWDWTHGNTDMLRNALSSKDQKTFYFDPRALDWKTYIETYCLGTKQFILKEDLSGLPAARAHLKKLRNIRYTFNTVIVVLLWRFLIARSEIARNTWMLFMGLVYKFVQFFRITSTMRS